MTSVPAEGIPLSPTGTVRADEHPAITAYTHALRRSLAGRPDADDLVDEVVDHLLESAQRLQRDGMDAAAAASESVRRFGDRDVVVRAYRSLPGGTAMPTPFTRAAGVAGLLTAVAGLLLVVAQTAETVAVAGGRYAGVLAETEWTVLAVSLLLLQVLLVGGVAVRAGLARRPWFAVVLAPLVAAVVIGVYAWWFLPLWGVLVSLAALAVAMKAPRRFLSATGGTVWPLWLLAASWPLGSAVFFALEPLALGPVDVHGDHPATLLLFTVVTAALLVPSSARLGWWMAREATASRSELSPLAHA